MQDITFIGEPVSDSATFKKLPFELQSFLLTHNGLIAYRGGVHFRGCCKEPLWHSLGEAWNGASAFWKHYPLVKHTDIPFAQDAVGNQFLLRHGRIWFLDTETGQMHNLQVDFARFIEGIERFPDKALDLSAIAHFAQLGGGLAPGELIAVFPPTCIVTDGQSIKYTRMPTETRLLSLVHLYKQIKRLKPGQKITVRTDEPAYEPTPEPTLEEPQNTTETAAATDAAANSPATDSAESATTTGEESKA